MKYILDNTWKILLPSEKKKFRILIFLDVLVSIADILFLAVLLWIIQFYLQPERKVGITFLPDWLLDRNSAWLIAVFFVLFLLKNVAAYFVNKYYFRFAGNVAVRISRDSLEKYQRSAFTEFVAVDSSVHIRRIALQPFEFSQQILFGIQQLFTQGILVFMAVLAILLFNARLFLLLMVILLPPVVAVFYYIKKRLSSVRKNMLMDNQTSYRYLGDALRGYVEGNVYDRNDFFLNRFVKTRKKFSNALFTTTSYQAMPTRVIELFAVMGLFILIAIAKWMNFNDSSFLITIGAFIAAAYKIIPGLVKIITVSGQMRAYEFYLEDLVNPERSEQTGAQRANEIIESVKLSNINFSYKENIPVLSKFDLHVQKGDFVAITGNSGRGKTTLFNILLGFLDPGNGEILVNNEKMNGRKLKNIWPSIAYVRQQPFLIHDSILKNITLEENGHDKKRLNDAIEAAGLKEFIKSEPQGIEKLITENGKNISGGQQQRIALARALYKDASLYLLDEPFSELDDDSVTKGLEQLKKLSQQGKTIIMITHDKKSLSWCNKIVSMDEQAS